MIKNLGRLFPPISSTIYYRIISPSKLFLFILNLLNYEDKKIQHLVLMRGGEYNIVAESNLYF